MIKIINGEVPCCAYVSEVPNHLAFKTWFTDYLKNKPVFSIKDTVGTCIHNTDFFVREFHTEYREAVAPIINQHNLSLAKFLGYLDRPIEIDQIWFQQYVKGDSHNWHRHLKCVFSNVYFINLPSKSGRTLFRFMGEEFNINVEEGQILTFPSFFEHCSNPNPSDAIKTVISFNSN